MEEPIHINIGGKWEKRTIKVDQRASSLFPWPGWFTGLISGLTEQDEFGFLTENCVLEAMYRAHRYTLELIDREGQCKAVLT